MNYTELTTAIQDYCENNEATFVSQIPTFVRQAEERITRAVMLPELRKNVVGNCSADDRYLARPADMLSVFSIAVIDGGQYYYLLDKDPNFLREAYPDPTATGRPQYYAMFSGDDVTEPTEGYFTLAPTPDQSYQIELYYYYDPASIVDEGTSWLGENAESALLYGSLVEAYTFMKGDPDMLTTYRERYTEAMAGLNVVGLRSTRDDYRDGRLQIRR